MAIKLGRLGGATISRIILAAVKRTGKNASLYGIARKVRSAFVDPKPLVHITAKENNRHLDIKLFFRGCRRWLGGASCDR